MVGLATVSEAADAMEIEVAEKASSLFDSNRVSVEADALSDRAMTDTAPTKDAKNCLLPKSWHSLIAEFSAWSFAREDEDESRLPGATNPRASSSRLNRTIHKAGMQSFMLIIGEAVRFRVPPSLF